MKFKNILIFIIFNNIVFSQENKFTIEEYKKNRQK